MLSHLSNLPLAMYLRLYILEQVTNNKEHMLKQPASTFEEYDPTTEALAKTEEDYAMEERREFEQEIERNYEYSLDLQGEC